MIQEKKNKQNQQQKPNKIKGGKRKKKTIQSIIICLGLQKQNLKHM